MTVIFAILGVGLFGGGLYAVYDGWPYLVLERGFTQVIIGTVAATAGLIMLSLAWVLREIRTLRREWGEAGEHRQGHAGMPAGEPLAVAPVSVVDPVRRGSGPVLGAGAALVAASAVAAAVSRDDDGEKASGMPERDLFGSLVAERLSAEPAEEPAEDESAPGGAEADRPVADLFAPGLEAGGGTEDRPAKGDGDSGEPAEVVSAMVQPLSQDEALAKTDLAEAVPVATGFSKSEETNAISGELRREPSFDLALEAGAEESMDGEREREQETIDAESLPPLPEPVAPPGSARREPPDEPEIDEFSALRESLTSQLGAPYRPHDKAESAPARDPFALPDDWLSPISGRREPSFALGEPAMEPEMAAEAEPEPSWPPRTASPAFADPHAGQAAAEPSPSLEHAPVSETREDEPAEVGPEPAPQEPVPPEPASSEEGVVGAYQVGDAHFTIFADGSIRARTPDGEYSFASMDELKVYLASEKSRLGV